MEPPIATCGAARAIERRRPRNVEIERCGFRRGDAVIAEHQRGDTCFCPYLHCRFERRWGHKTDAGRAVNKSGHTPANVASVGGAWRPAKTLRDCYCVVCHEVPDLVRIRDNDTGYYSTVNAFADSI